MATQTGSNIGIINNWAPGDNGWSTAMNAALRAQDALMQANVVSASTTTPPGSPTEGAAYIVPASATGAWSGRTGQVTRWSVGLAAWEFWTPKKGWRIVVQDQNLPFIYTGAFWTIEESSAYIDGLKLVWNNATSLSVSTGSAYVPGFAGVLPVNALITKASLSLTASTFYHVYIFANASGVADAEIVTTAPAAAYFGTARAKTGDTTRRYIGSVLTDSSGNVYAFLHDKDAGLVMYNTNILNAPFNVLSAGTATTATAVACSGCVPATATVAALLGNNNDTAAAVLLGNSVSPPVAAPLSAIAQLPSTRGSDFLMPLDSSLSFQYLYLVSPTANVVIRVRGYFFER